MIHGGELTDNKIIMDYSVNLNPEPCPEQVKAAVMAAADRICEYPDYYQTRVREKVARAETVLSAKGVTFLPENVIGGNGASELIAAIIRAVAPRKALIVCPCFSGYVHGLNMVSGCSINTYYLREENDFIPDKEFLSMIKPGTDLVILANPNNPTGKAIDEELLLRILDKSREVGAAVLVDECFYRLSDNRSSVSAREYIFEYDNLYVLDAYTKLFSIPGVRAGFCLSAGDNIRKIADFLPEWNMSVFAQEAAAACAEIAADTDFIQRSQRTIAAERSFLTEKLTNAGIKVVPSDTLFLLCKGKEGIFNSMLVAGVLIRDCSNFEGLGKEYFRIAIKQHSSNLEFLELFFRNV